MMKKDTKYITVIIIMAIIILILLYYSSKKFGYIGLVPTGNVDIFNIECINGDKCECNTENVFDEDKDKDKDKTEDKIDNDKEYDMPGFGVNDNDVNWNSTNELRIFSNPAYEFRSVIAPGSSNTYQFVVNNNNSFDVVYNLDFIETNIHSINMKYKLKRNGEYVAGSLNKWVSYEELNIKDLYVRSKIHDTFSLEWKWIDNDNDTSIGFSDANYVLKINIYAKSA